MPYLLGTSATAEDESQPWRVELSRGGDVVALSTIAGSPADLLPGVQGLGPALSSVPWSRLGGVHGARPGELQRAQASRFLPVRLWAPTQADLFAAAAALERVVSAAGGPCTVTVVSPAGRRSAQAVRVVTEVETLDRSSLQPMGGGWGLTRGLVLQSGDPYWLGDPIELEWALPEPSPFFPLLPVRLSSSEVLGTEQVAQQGGDVEGIGVWRLSGPWVRARLSDERSGRSFVLEPPSPVAAYEVVTVHTDVRSGVRVVAPNGSSAWSWLRPPFDLWPIAPGARVRVQMDGAGRGSSATLRLTPRFEAAL